LESSLFTNGSDLVQSGILRVVSPVTASISAQISTRVDPDGVLAKMLDGQPYSTEDTVQLEAWLSERGLETELVSPVSKLIRRSALSSEDLVVLKTWLEANGFSNEAIEDLLSMFKPYE
jgi:hypothetical protein